MKAEEFRKYQGKETFGNDGLHLNVYNNGVVVGYSDNEDCEGQSLLTKVKLKGELLSYLGENPNIPNAEEKALFDCREGKDYTYLWCRRENVKL